jgi:CheY-specific phosphatase CheX
MTQQLKHILTGVANDTLERLAFMFAFPDDDRRQDGPEPAVTGCVEFSGLFCGSLVVRVPTCVMPEMAANMLGLEDDAEISGEAQRDALKELTNVICGNLLPAVAGDQVEFNIGAPETLSPLDARKLLSRDIPACVVRLMLEDGYCDVYLFTEGELPESAIKLESRQD